MDDRYHFITSIDRVELMADVDGYDVCLGFAEYMADGGGWRGYVRSAYDDAADRRELPVSGSLNEAKKRLWGERETVYRNMG